MFAVFSQINWLAVALATVALAGLGALYFMVLVPTQYVRVLGREDAPKAAPRTVDGVGPLVCCLAIVVTSAILIAALGIDTIADALVFGLIVGVGYLLAMTFNIAINPSFPHPIRYGLLNAPYFLVGSLLSSTILVLL